MKSFVVVFVFVVVVTVKVVVVVEVRLVISFLLSQCELNHN